MIIIKQFFYICRLIKKNEAEYSLNSTSYRHICRFALSTIIQNLLYDLFLYKLNFEQVFLLPHVLIDSAQNKNENEKKLETIA